MAAHDFLCTVCGQVLVDVQVPASVGAIEGAPMHCAQKTSWIPQIGRMDAFEPGQEFIQYDGQNRPVQVESFAQMRALERDSEQQERNGEGTAIRFRALHQNRGNMQDNTFGPTPQEKPTAEAIRKYAPRLCTEEPTYGPGVSDANTSALKDT